MKVIVVNRKRLGITVIIVGLMLVLFGFEKQFDGRLKYVALMQSSINSLKHYEGLNKKLSYKLPSQWTTKEQSFGGNEIIYHNEFVSEDATIHGIVEVWNNKENLKKFLDDSKKVSDEMTQTTDYKREPISIKNHQGYLVTYIQASQNNYYKAYEYFIDENNQLIRFSFFVRESNFKDNMPTIFKTIVETFNYKQ